MKKVIEIKNIMLALQEQKDIESQLSASPIKGQSLYDQQSKYSSPSKPKKTLKKNTHPNSQRKFSQTQPSKKIITFQPNRYQNRTGFSQGISQSVGKYNPITEI